MVYTKNALTGGLTTTQKTDTDAFVFRHIFDRPLGYCAFSMDLQTATVNRRITSYNGVSAQQQGLTALYTKDSDVPKTRLAQD